MKMTSMICWLLVERSLAKSVYIFAQLRVTCPRRLIINEFRRKLTIQCSFDLIYFHQWWTDTKVRKESVTEVNFMNQSWHWLECGQSRCLAITLGTTQTGHNVSSHHGTRHWKWLSHNVRDLVQRCHQMPCNKQTPWTGRVVLWTVEHPR